MNGGPATERAVLGGRYELGAVIGQGGMAVVHEGRDLNLDRPVAVKLLRPELAHEPTARGRFESEGRLAARLSHPNIVSVLDAGHEDGQAYIVMERLSGRTLHDELASGPLSVPAAHRLAAEMLAALGAAHQAGILHRDLKPGNILAGAAGEWKLGDFGIAKAAEMPTSDHTGTGLVIGTAAYLAPERFLGGDATVSSDLFGLGVVLYESLAGRKPFDPYTPQAWAPEAATAVPTPSAPAPIRTVRPQVDAGLAGAIDRALSADPGQRFGSAAEMAAAISGETRAEMSAEVTRVMPGEVTRVMPGARPGKMPGPASWADVPPVAGAGARPAPTSVLARPREDLWSRIPGAWADLGGRGLRVPAMVAGAVLVLLIVVLAATSGHHAQSGPTSSTTVPSTTVPAAANLPSGLDQALRDLANQVRH